MAFAPAVELGRRVADVPRVSLHDELAAAVVAQRREQGPLLAVARRARVEMRAEPRAEVHGAHRRRCSTGELLRDDALFEREDGRRQSLEGVLPRLVRVRSDADGERAAAAALLDQELAPRRRGRGPAALHDVAQRREGVDVGLGRRRRRDARRRRGRGRSPPVRPVGARSLEGRGDRRQAPRRAGEARVAEGRRGAAVAVADRVDGVDVALLLVAREPEAREALRRGVDARPQDLDVVARPGPHERRLVARRDVVDPAQGHGDGEGRRAARHAAQEPVALERYNQERAPRRHVDLAQAADAQALVGAARALVGRVVVGEGVPGPARRGSVGALRDEQSRRDVPEPLQRRLPRVRVRVELAE